MVNILVVEDDPAIRLLIKTRLAARYNVLEAAEGSQALSVMSEWKVDLLIVDVMMDGMNGFNLVKSLRDMSDTTPVIMVTALSAMNYKKKGFELGVDDYMTKPVDCDELLWRIEAILRRSRINSSNEIHIGSLVLSQEKRNAEWDGGSTDLTDREFSLLFKLLSWPGTVFTKQQIMDEVWGFDSEADYSTIKTYINRLRNKFESCRDFELFSVRGLGYKAEIPEGGENGQE